MVIERDVFHLKETLLSLGTLNLPHFDSTYQTKYFFEFVIDEVDIDVMAGFAIVYDGKVYDCSLYEDQIIEYKFINNVKIPLQSILLWREYYRLMHRDNKVLLIDNANKNY